MVFQVRKSWMVEAAVWSPLLLVKTRYTRRSYCRNYADGGSIPPASTFPDARLAVRNIGIKETADPTLDRAYSWAVRHGEAALII